MVYVAPDHFFDKNFQTFYKIGHTYCLDYVLKQSRESIALRTTMYSLSLILEGSKIYHHHNQDMVISTNNALLQAPTNYFIAKSAEQNVEFRTFNIYFNEEFVFDLIKKYHIKNSSNTKQDTALINFSKDNLLQDNIQLLLRYIDKKCDEELLKLKIDEIFLHLLRLNKQSFLSFIAYATASSKFHIKYLLEENIDSLHNIDDMCHITLLSPSQLRRYIKSEFKMTPKIWLDSFRLKKAITLLKNTQKSVTDISTECGYASPSWFIAQFKKEFNLTPKEFRYKV